MPKYLYAELANLVQARLNCGVDASKPFGIEVGPTARPAITVAVDTAEVEAGIRRFDDALGQFLPLPYEPVEVCPQCNGTRVTNHDGWSECECGWSSLETEVSGQ